jgi:hypothetical protein
MEQDTDAKIISMIEELQKQVGYLERKIEALIAQSASAGHARHQRFSGAGREDFRARGHSFDKKHGEGHRREKYAERKRPFRPGDKDRQAKNRRKFFPGSFDKHK